MYGAQSGNVTVTTASYAPIGTPVQQAVGHIPDAMNETDRLVLTLADELSTLEARLCGILRPAPPTANGPGDSAPKPVVSPLADGLAGINSRLHMSIMRVRDLAARADL